MPLAFAGNRDTDHRFGQEQEAGDRRAGSKSRR
jgi:hypothetical protein